MAPRIITGLILAGAAIAILTIAPPWASYVLFQLAAVLCGDEFYRIVLGPDRVRERLVGSAIIASTVGVAWFAPALLPAVFLLAGPLLLTLVLFSSGDVKDLAPRAAYLLTGIVYLAVPLVALTLLANPRTAPGFGPLLVLALFAAVFAGDSGAFFAGKFLGKHKLYEKISPKKTWEGSVGGAIASTLGFLLITKLGSLPFSVPVALGLGFAVGVVEQIGDLVESLFKRAAGVKDSGSLLPGHGGVLDRVDGVLFGAPVLLAILTV